MNPLFLYTIKSLRKNKTRTIVTIIGIMMSSALLVALATMGSSLYHYMQEGYTYENGDWHIGITNGKKQDLEALLSDVDTEDPITAKSIGYAEIENADHDKPYLYLRGVTQEYYEHMPIHLTEGHLPEREGELLLPESFRKASSETQVPGIYTGADITLDTGLRLQDGEALWQHIPYASSMTGIMNKDTEEILSSLQNRSYTIVGFYEPGNGYNDKIKYEAPGYEALTWWDGMMTEDAYNRYSIWFRIPNVSNNKFHGVYDRIRLIYGYDGYQLPVNLSLLSLHGVRISAGGESMAVAAAAVILLAIILTGSVMLIYNAFAISVSERTRQFGLLSSIGATGKQIRQSVLYEAGIVSGAGALLGVSAGILIVSAVLSLAGETVRELMHFSMKPRLYPWPPAILLATALAILTVLVSALIPALRATKVTAIEAIRQNREINYSGKTGKTYRRSGTILGYEGTLALIYSDRNRKRYRITTLALFLSMVLFVSINAFTDYLMTTIQAEYKSNNYDLLVQFPAEKELTPEQCRELIAKLHSMDGVKSVTQPIYLAYQMPSEENTGHVTKHFETILESTAGTGKPSASISIVDDESFLSFCREHDLDESLFLNPERLTVIIKNDFKAMDPKSGNVRLVEGLLEHDGTFYVDLASDRYYLEDNQKDIVEFTAGYFADSLAPGCNDSWNLSIMLPQSVADSLGLRAPAYGIPPLCLVSSDHLKTETAVSKLLETKYPGGTVYNLAARQAGDRNLIFLLRLLANGFIIMITIISAANVFSTISSSLKLRQKEFAMLETVGMTRQGLRRMLNLECLLYGGKAVLLGLPVSIMISSVMYYYFHKDVIFNFYLPVQSILVAVGSIFAVVFVTMLYTMGRIRKENVIDVLKQENF